MSEGEDAQDEEVDREQEVDVVFAEDLEENVKSEEGARSDQGEHGGVLEREKRFRVFRFLIKRF